MDCSPPDSSVHRILWARILEWVAIPFSRGSSWPRDQTRVSCITSRFFTVCTTKKPLSVVVKINFAGQALGIIRQVCQGDFLCPFHKRTWMHSSFFWIEALLTLGFLGDSVVKNPSAPQEPQEMQARPLCREDPLEEGLATHSSILAWRIPMDSGAWQATVYGVIENWTQLKRLSTHTQCLLSKGFGVGWGDDTWVRWDPKEGLVWKIGGSELWTEAFSASEAEFREGRPLGVKERL